MDASLTRGRQNRTELSQNRSTIAPIAAYLVGF